MAASPLLCPLLLLVSLIVFGIDSLGGFVRLPTNASSIIEIDQIFTTELRHKSEGILIKTGQPWQINLYGGVSHGFAVRADLSNKNFKFAKEQAFCQAVTWFNQYL